MGINIGPFVELETVQVQLKNRDNVFFQQEEGLSVVYGVNGVGKSTIIEGLRLLLGDSARPELSQRVRGYLKFHAPLDWLDCAADGIEEFFESEYFKSLRRRAKPPARPWYEVEFKLAIPIWEEPSDDIQESLVAFKKWMKESWAPDNDVDYELLERTSDIDEIPEELLTAFVIGKIMMKSVQHQGHAQSNPLDFVKTFLAFFREGITSEFSGSSGDVLSFEIAVSLCEKYSIRLNIDEQSLISLDFDTMAVSDIADLFVLTKMKRFDDVLERLVAEEDYFQSCVEDDAETVDVADEHFESFVEDDAESVDIESLGSKVGDRIPDAIDLGKSLFVAMQNSLMDGTFWFEPRTAWDSQRTKWTVGLALETSTEDESVIQLREFIDAKRPTAETIETPYWEALSYLFFESFCFPNTFQTSAPHTRPSIASDFDSFEVNRQFFCVPGPICELNNFPLALVDLNAPLDLDRIAQETLLKLVNDEVDATFVVDEHVAEGALKIPKLGRVELFLKELGDFLRRLEIGISGCFFAYSENLVDWAKGNTAHFLFETSSTSGNLYDKRIRFEALSSAQKYWVSAAFKMKLAQFESNEHIMVADEPESGLHERAVVRVLEELSRAAPSAVIASHSSRALSLRSARLLHLERTEAGKTVLNPPHLGEDVTEAALRLGTSTFELFGLKRALVLVEGSHDVEVIRGLASLDPSRNLLDKLLIVPCRGVRNVATVADSAIVTDFTSLHFLVVVDNGRIGRLREMVDLARYALDSGQSASHAVAASGLKQASMDSSFEERVLLDLIERAIHRRVLNRLHLFALPCEDIIELLPPEAFGLDCSWQELRQDFRSSPVRANFKEWIRTSRGITISTKTVRRAYDKIDALSEDLEALRRELEVVASLSPLD